MKELDQATAFNKLFQPGDMLLVRDIHGFNIIGKLHKRAFVLDKNVFFELEDHPGLLPVYRVIGKISGE